MYVIVYVIDHQIGIEDRENTLDNLYTPSHTLTSHKQHIRTHLLNKKRKCIYTIAILLVDSFPLYNEPDLYFPRFICKEYLFTYVRVVRIL